MVNKEATTNKTRTASPAVIPFIRGQIAKQAALINKQDNGFLLTVTACFALRQTTQIGSWVNNRLYHFIRSEISFVVLF
jgi:hypothetical protein